MWFKLRMFSTYVALVNKGRRRLWAKESIYYYFHLHILWALGFLVCYWKKGPTGTFFNCRLNYRRVSLFTVFTVYLDVLICWLKGKICFVCCYVQSFFLWKKQSSWSENVWSYLTRCVLHFVWIWFFQLFSFLPCISEWKMFQNTYTICGQ